MVGVRMLAHPSGGISKEGTQTMRRQRDTSEDDISNAISCNLIAADLHEEVARCHREAAELHRRLNNSKALSQVSQAHAKCNEAFDATITAHWISADATPLMDMP